MKKRIILSALALIAAVACQKTVVPELSVSTNTINLGPQGGQTMLTVTSNAPLGDFTVTSLAWHRTVAASIIKKILFLIDMIILQGDT